MCLVDLAIATLLASYMMKYAILQPKKQKQKQKTSNFCPNWVLSTALGGKFSKQDPILLI